MYTQATKKVIVDQTKQNGSAIGPTLQPVVSADEELVLFQEAVRRHLQVEGRWALADPPRDVIMRAVAWAEPAAKVSRIWEWDAAQVGAHTNDNQPLRVLDTLSILLRVAEGGNIDAVGQLDVILCSSPDEDWLAPPLNSHSGARFNA